MRIKTKLFVLNFILFLVVTGCAVLLVLNQGIFFSKAMAGTLRDDEFHYVQSVFSYLEDNIYDTETNLKEMYQLADDMFEENGVNYSIVVLSNAGDVMFSEGDRSAVNYCVQLLDSREHTITMYSLDNLIVFHRAYDGTNVEIFAISNNFVNYSLTYTMSIAGIIMMVSLFAVLFLICFILETNTIFPKLTKLRGGLRQITRGKYDFELIPSSDDEIGVICKEFDEMRQKLLQLEAKKQELDNRRNDVIAGITHDLKTPITTIVAYSRGILDGLPKTEEKRQSYLKTIHNTALDLNSLLDRLHDFSAINSDNRKLELIRTDLAAFIDSFVKDNASIYKEKGAMLSCKVPRSSVFADIDVVEFIRVFQNIIGNSIKYKQNPTVKVKIDLTQSLGFAIIRISDDGPGIKDNAELSHIFESYFRGDTARTNPTKEGSGLGLAIVKNIVLLHHGDVQARSENGLTITITIPQQGE